MLKMEWLNYHHLFYFSVIAEEGGVASAARKLRLTHSTLSAQLRALEEQLGTPLFERRGKRLVLTPFGIEATNYAADIFRLGRELNDVAKGRARPGRDALRIGAVAAIPKTLVHHLLTPALDQLEGGTAFIRQDAPTNLVDALAAGRLHLVLTNEVPTTPLGARIHTHALGETEILLYARADLAKSARRRFPQSLSGVPFVLPPGGTQLRRRLDEWFAEENVEAVVAAEVDDAGLLRVLGSAGRGVFPVRAAIKAEVEDLHDVQLVGQCGAVRERYYAVTIERRIKHPALAALVEGARADLHAPGPKPGRRSGGG
jgi:LysR family transcriptional regulator, transcriptional activator of nhaA